MAPLDVRQEIAEPRVPPEDLIGVRHAVDHAERPLAAQQP